MAKLFEVLEFVHGIAQLVNHVSETLNKDPWIGLVLGIMLVAGAIATMLIRKVRHNERIF